MQLHQLLSRLLTSTLLFAGAGSAFASDFIDASTLLKNATVEAIKDLRRRDLIEVPRTNGILNRLKERVFADPLGTAQH